MTHLERIRFEVQGISLDDTILSIYLEENDLLPYEEYNPLSNTSKKNIHKTALSILESIANNPTLLKNYKADDVTVSAFAENIQARIDQLERKIRQMKIDGQEDSSFFYLFNH